MKFHNVFVLLFIVFVSSLCSYAMDDRSLFMDNDVANLRPKIKACSAILNQDAHYFNPELRHKALSIDEIVKRAVKSCEIARLAHLSSQPNLRLDQYAMWFDPNSVSDEGLPGIPQSLKGLPGVQILYYPSPHLPSRVNGGCATRALGNALAIRDAKLKNSLNPRMVVHLSAQHDDLNSHASTASSECAKLALALNLPQLHWLAYFNRKLNDAPKNNPFSIIASACYHHPQLNHSVNLHKEDNFQAAIVQQIRRSTNIVVHFMASVDRINSCDHAILISIVKQAGQMPRIIYMDCNNEPIKDQSKDAAFIHYLYLQCIA